MLPSTLRAHIQSWTPTRKCSGLVPSGAVQQHQRSQNPNVFTGKPHISQSQMKKERKTVSWSIVSVEIFLNLDCFQEANTAIVSCRFRFQPAKLRFFWIKKSNAQRMPENSTFFCVALWPVFWLCLIELVWIGSLSFDSEQFQMRKNASTVNSELFCQ